VRCRCGRLISVEYTQEILKYLLFEFDGTSVKLKPTNRSKDNVSHAEFWSSAVLAEWKNTVGRYSKGRFKVLLVRHATPVFPGSSGFDDHQRPLTAKGVQAAIRLRKELKQVSIDAIYSSPYARAIQTVRPLAQSRSLEVQATPDFREHALAGELLTNWHESLETAWKDFDHRFPGGATMRETQTRGLNALERIRLELPGGTVAIGGHGTLFSLMLNAIEPRVGCVSPRHASACGVHDHA
jgi:2,3-bisphosphoglycerate-dependent phosphoglycerate mutase